MAEFRSSRRMRPPAIPAEVASQLSRTRLIRRYADVTEVETLQRQLQREQRNLDQREYELSEAQARVHSLVAQRNNLRQSVKEIQERLDAAERLVALEEENATLRRQVAECNNVHKSSF